MYSPKASYSNSVVVTSNQNTKYRTDGIDDHIQIQQAIDDLQAIGGGRVIFGSGETFNCNTIYIPEDGTPIDFFGDNSTIKLNNNANSSLIETKNYFTVRGGNGGSGFVSFSGGIILDGNKDNQTALVPLTDDFENHSAVLKYYGYGLRISKSVNIKNGHQIGLLSEWGASYGTATHNGKLESVVEECYIYGSKEVQVVWRGSHDSIFKGQVFSNNTDIVVANRPKYNMCIESSKAGTQIVSGQALAIKSHIYGRCQFDSVIIRDVNSSGFPPYVTGEIKAEGADQPNTYQVNFNGTGGHSVICEVFEGLNGVRIKDAAESDIRVIANAGSITSTACFLDSNGVKLDLNLTNNTFKYIPYKSANRITGKIIAYSVNPAIDDMERDGSNNPYQYKSKIWIKELVNVGNSDMSIYIDSPDYARLFTNKQIRKAYKNDVYVDVPNDIAYLPLFIDSFYVDNANYVSKCNLPSEVWWSESMQRILVVNNHSTNNLNIQTTAQTQFTSDIILSPKTASLFVCDKDKWYKV